MKLWNCRYSEVRLGGTIAARANRAGVPVRLAARTTDSAEALRRSGLRVSGFGGEVRAEPIEIDVGVLEGGDLPGQIASSGVPILYVPLRSRVAVDAATIERGKLRALLRSVNLDELPAFVFARQQADDDATVHSRMFRPASAVRRTRRQAPRVSRWARISFSTLRCQLTMLRGW